MSLLLQNIIDASVSRSNRWHKGDFNSWSLLEWAGAMAGEAGEACNAAKKVKRLEDKIPSINETKRHFTDVGDAKFQVAKEVADTILYGVMVAARAGFNSEEIESIVREVFNKKSIEYGFPERI